MITEIIGKSQDWRKVWIGGRTVVAMLTAGYAKAIAQDAQFNYRLSTALIGTGIVMGQG